MQKCLHTKRSGRIYRDQYITLWLGFFLKLDFLNNFNQIKVRLFLQESSNKVAYYLDIQDQTILDELILKDNSNFLLNALEKIENEVKDPAVKMDVENPMISNISSEINKIIDEQNINKLYQKVEELGIQDEEDNNNQQVSNTIYKINEEHTKITKYFIEKNIPIFEEYDYSQNQNLAIELKTSTKIRHYQEKALSKVFIQEKARSGVIVLPCGAGKTLVGISIVSKIKSSTIIFCDKALAIEQWRQQFKQFAEIDDNNIIRLSSKYVDCDKFNNLKSEGCIVITTYNMISTQKQRAETKNEKTQNKRNFIEKMKNMQWSLCILDEVQVVPANKFQRVLLTMKAHFKIGLTATLIREDMKISDLNYMIGPTLYEENWLDLVNEGYLARPYCVEVRVQMTPEFLEEYKISRNEMKILLYAGNPNKFLALQYLIKRHEARGDKILVFGDKPAVIKCYGERLKMPVAVGHVQQEERKVILDYFQRSNKINTIFLSSVGDTSIDLPNANVVIQISSHYGSRRQEAQRLGRIMRPKENDYGTVNAFFYTLISQETDETAYAIKRQRFLIDQGFSYEIITQLPYMKNSELKKELQMCTKQEQLEHLAYLKQLRSEKTKPQKSEISSESSAESSSESENESPQMQIVEQKNPLLRNQQQLYIQASK